MFGASSPLVASGLDPAALKPRWNPSDPINGSMTTLRLELPSGQAPSGLQGEFAGHPIYFYPRPDLGERMVEALVGVPYELKAGTARAKVWWGDKAQAAELELGVAKGEYGNESLKVDPAKVSPPKWAMPRIRREIAAIKKFYGTVTPERQWAGPFVLPISSPVTSQFGTRRLYNGEPRNFHPGLDLKAAEGTEIHAPAPGKVVLVQSMYFTGNTVMIDHGLGLYTIYAHLSQPVVKVGAAVKTGDLLGRSGATGRVSGPHLHWQAVLNRVKINPMDLVTRLQ